MFLHEMLEFGARRAPDELALAFGDERWSFAQLSERVAAVGSAFASMVEPGARVAVLAENTPAFVECYYAVPRAGAILTFLNYRLHPREWAWTLEHSGASVLVGERALIDRLGTDRPAGVRDVVALDDAAVGETPYRALVESGSGAPRAHSDADTAWLIYTSGTTGRPKGAMLTHRSLAAGVTSLAVARPIAVDDVYLFPFPLCHVAGYNVLAHHLHGRPVVLMRRFDAAEVVAHIRSHEVTQVSLAPTMIDMLLHLPGLDTAELPTLRGIGYGASPIPPEVLRRGVEVLGCDFSQGYGMTELSGNAVFLGPHEHRLASSGDDALAKAAGVVSPLASVRVVDDDLRDVEVGAIGEIVVRGDQVMAGYWDDAAATAAALRDGWFRTGDLGRFDTRGYLSVVDRKKDVIVTGGENVASREVEDVLSSFPGVREVAVVGLPDPRWGESVCAVVVPRTPGGVDAAELIEHARGRLAGYKTPRRVVFTDELPKNAAGKILKRELREIAPGLAARER